MKIAMQLLLLAAAVTCVQAKLGWMEYTIAGASAGGGVLMYEFEYLNQILMINATFLTNVCPKSSDSHQFQTYFFQF